MAQIQQITPVTDQLRDSLIETLAVLEQLSGHINDAAHYEKAVRQLERLTVAVLAAISSTPLLAVELSSKGGRFNLGPQTTLAKTVSTSVAYLKDDASVLLLAGNFQRYQSENATRAKSHLQSLYADLLFSIKTIAARDLEELLGRGPEELIVAAEYLATRCNRAQRKDRDKTCPDTLSIATNRRDEKS